MSLSLLSFLLLFYQFY